METAAEVAVIYVALPTLTYGSRDADQKPTAGETSCGGVTEHDPPPPSHCRGHELVPDGYPRLARHQRADRSTGGCRGAGQ